jgi:hypothetical protein
MKDNVYATTIHGQSLETLLLLNKIYDRTNFNVLRVCDIYYKVDDVVNNKISSRKT